MRLATFATGVLAVLPGLTGAVELNDDSLKKVYDVMNQINKFSWENGSRSQAIIEYSYPKYSIFGDGAFKLDGAKESDMPEVVQLAKWTLENRAAAKRNHTMDIGGVPKYKRQVAGGTATSSGAPSATSSPSTAQNIPALANPQLPPGEALLDDGASGDPPALGIAVMMAAHATGNANVGGISYNDAATSQLNYLLYHVPRTTTGAISHRRDQPQLWSDFVYMVPPFIAYYGAQTKNQTLLQIAYDQIRLYRDGLRQKDTNLWAHIVQGHGASDPGRWATGNAWAVTGILRVISTIKATSFAGDMGNQLTDLQVWAQEIMNAAQPLMTENGLLRNYIDNSSTFEDSTASTLMAYGGFRMSNMGLTNDYVKMSVTLLKATSGNVNSTGFLTKVTDPLSFVNEGTYSPEGNTFIILAYAAYKDWVAAGKPNNPGSDHPLEGAAARTVAGATTVLAAVVGSLLFVLV